MEIDYASVPFDSWTEVKKNVFCLRRKDSYAIVYPNVSAFSSVSEWQSECYRLPENSGTRIDGVTIKGSNFDQCKIFLEAEMGYLLTIQVPWRSLLAKEK